MKNLKTLHIVGPKKSGKTTLLEFLIRELRNKGLRIGALKHSSHQHPLDKEGSDSDRLRKAGGNPTIFSTPNGMAIFLDDTLGPNTEEILSTVYRDCDLVLVESFRDAPGPKIVVGDREEIPPQLANVIAVVNEHGVHSHYPAFQSQDSKLIYFIIRRFNLEKLVVSNK